MPRAEIKERILNSKTIDENGCWIWQKRISSTGYGQIWVTTSFGKGSVLGAHRVSYRVFKGDIDEGLQIDHLCKVRSCINPDHLEAVTAQENVHRSDANYKKLKAKTHCINGHEFSQDNIFKVTTKEGWNLRQCKTCDYDRHRATRIKKRDLAYATA